MTGAGIPAPLHDGLPGLDAEWSRVVQVPETTGLEPEPVTRSWHVLDTGPVLEAAGHEITGTVLAVHGNPTWSYLWRQLLTASLAQAEAGGPAWRIVAVDQLEMGFSERTEVVRDLPQRIADLGALTDVLDLGPVVTLGHDWGGVISLGWALAHPDQLAGIALLNTAVHQGPGPIPAPLRLAGAAGVLPAATRWTTAFLDTTLALAHPPLTAPVRAAYRAPYRTAARRRGIGDFVADIPVGGQHPSTEALARIAAGVRGLRVPTLLLWGPRDPIFGDRYLDDLLYRLPHARVHRFEGAGHLVAEDAPWAGAVLDWLPAPQGSAGLPTREGAPSDPPTGRPSETGPAFRPLGAALEERAQDSGVAVVDMAGRAPVRVSWRLLARNVERLAAGLLGAGVRAGDRVSLLVPPGPDLTACVYACLRIGAVVVVADAGLGVDGLSRAVRGAQADIVIGKQPGLAAARTLGWPGRRISVDALPAPVLAALGVTATLPALMRDGERTLTEGVRLPPHPGPEEDAAVLFTSGSTGPAKGVRYTHAQLSAVRDVLTAELGLTPETGLVTGFAPFALLGPALGTRSATPDMDVSAPRTLTARAVADAVAASGARTVFLSPAAVLNVARTADELSAADREALGGVTQFLSTGAPVSAAVLGSVAELMPAAVAHTPYGMTECLLVTDITLPDILGVAGADDAGVCVGRPVHAAQVRISALDPDGRAAGAPTQDPGVLGEVLVSAPHLKDGYDRLWLTDLAAARDTPSGGRWHRTGDVGHLDGAGRLWIEGRLAHVLTTPAGPLAPVGPEQQVERAEAVRRAAIVGVGPAGIQQTVAVVETHPRARRAGLATAEVTEQVRAACATPLAAVLSVPELPTDVRHNSKIDRGALAAWADRLLAGERARAPR
ncbi:alpha/beta fold hydrolase [Ruania suaedae]|uniref:alpha/beta fold hydrolase n=1 Tax=Ruania suaedae TaxID=2897774 RepID=UPI001E574831|nr:alpha/beta fold hydrolase [Ruania suaedae]UFU01697.1 alpha/beta fold hydrolase [Ruania suaedae]